MHKYDTILVGNFALFTIKTKGGQTMSNGTESKKPSIKQLATLAGFITECLAEFLNLERVQYWLKNKTELKRKLREVFSITDEYGDIRRQWEQFYKNQFGWDMDFSLVLIPTRPEVGSWRLLFIAKGLTMNRGFEQCKKLFKSWRYNDDLDKAIPINARNANENYAVWVRDGIEPDAEHLGKSTRQVDPDMKIGITVLERIIFEIKYFLETGSRLDTKGVTFCSGSRFSGGIVPSCYWSPASGKFRVDWYNLDVSNSGSGVRSAVS